MNEKLASKNFVVNMECHLWLIREFLPAMVDKNKGQIVSVASMAGIEGVPYMADYCASKFGAVGLQESLRIEMLRAKKNIVCTTICPFFINTGMFDGVKASLLYPFLDQDYVIKRMCDAILQNEGEVSIPWSMGVITHSVKGFFSSSVCDFLVWLVIGYDAMADFRGRQEQNAIFKTGEK